MDSQSNSVTSNNQNGLFGVIVDGEHYDEYASINENDIRISNPRSEIREQDVRTNSNVMNTSRECVPVPPIPCERTCDSSEVHIIGTDSDSPYKRTTFLQQDVDTNPSNQFEFEKEKTDRPKLSNKIIILIVFISIIICVTIVVPSTVQLLKSSSQTSKDIPLTTKHTTFQTKQPMTTVLLRSTASSQPVILVSQQSTVTVTHSSTTSSVSPQSVTPVSSQPDTIASSQPVTSTQVSSQPVTPTQVSSQPVTTVTSQPVTTVSSQPVTSVSQQSTPSSTTLTGNCASSQQCQSCTCASLRCPVNGDLFETEKFGQTETCDGACFTEVRGLDNNKTHRGCVSTKGSVWIDASKKPGCYQLGSSYVCFCCGEFCNNQDMTQYYSSNQPSSHCHVTRV